MNKRYVIKSKLIAPCGLNCVICRGYLLNKKNKCPGCWGDNVNKSNSCVRCKIKNCDNLTKTKSIFCFECAEFPCLRIKQLDKRYRTKYNMSVLENLENIKKLGVRKFVQNEKIRWTCSECGGIICVHTGYCSNCGEKRK
jgi:hypothetical protein